MSNNQRPEEAVTSAEELDQEAISSADAVADYGDEKEPPVPPSTAEEDNSTVEKVTQAVNVDVNDKEPETPKTPAPALLNVLQQYDVYGPIDKRSSNLSPLVLIPKKLSRLGKDAPDRWQIPRDEIDEEMQGFVETYLYGAEQLQGGSHVPDKGFFDNAVEDQHSEWMQEVPHGESRISYRRPTIGDAGGKLLKGPAARARVGALLGTGISNKVPLTHTGLNIEVGTRSDADFIQLDYMLSNDRVKLGYNTVGMIYHNSHFGLVERVFDFIMESTLSINMLGWQDVDMAEYIRITDLPTLYYAQGATMFPNGYPLDLPCSTGPAVCRHVEQVNLNIQRTLWINKNKLSTYQRDMLTRLRHQHTVKEIEDYQTNSVGNFTKSFNVDCGADGEFEITLGVPTIRKYLDAGHLWADEANRAVEKALGNNVDPEVRYRYMQNLIGVASLREYSHWINRIRLPGNDWIDQTDDICAILEMFSTNSDVVEKIFEEIQRFIEEATIAIIAIPNFSCPKCGHDHSTDENSKHPELVPIDAFKLFFALKDRRLWRHGLSQTA